MPKFYRHVLTLEVLTADDTLDGMSLTDIAYEMSEGAASGVFISEVTEEVSRERMAELLIAQGSDPEFLIGEDDAEV